MNLMVWLCWLFTQAMAVSVSLEVGTRDLVVGQQVNVQVQLKDGSFRGIPDVPVPQGLMVEYQSQSQQHVVVNFQSTRIVRYTYLLTALIEGTHRIGPVEMDVGGRRFRSRAVDVTVSPRSSTPEQEDISGTLSDAEPFLGEVVVYTFVYRQRGQVYDASWTPPTFDGFMEEKHAETAQRDYRTSATGSGGPTITVQEVAVPLVAVGEGERVITPASLTAKVPLSSQEQRARRDPLFGMGFSGMGRVKTVTQSTRPIRVRVRPLPQEGKPADFSGLVGHFLVASKASARSVRLGESVTVEITIRGSGTLAGVRLPPVDANEAYRAYDDEPEIAASIRDGAVESVATFRRAVVPEKEGRLVVPGLTLSVFDPETEDYRRVRAAPIEIQVLPGEGAPASVSSFSEGKPDQRRAVEALGDDILPVSGTAQVSDHTVESAVPLALMLPGTPLLGLVGLWMSAWVRRRRRDPAQVLTRRLSALPTESSARLSELEAIFREAAALRLGLSAPGLEGVDIAPLGSDAEQLYRDLEAARYGGDDAGDLESRVRAFVEGW